MTDDKFYKRLPLYRILTVAAITITVIICCIQQITRRDGDPELFVFMARLLLNGQDIYTIPSPHGNFYYYPPFFACLNIPLIILPRIVLIFLWAIASVGLLGWSMAAFYSGMTSQPFFSLPVKTRWVVCFFATLLTARFIILHFRFGQTNIFVLALTVLGLVWLTRNKQVRTGIAIAFSIVIKLITLPFGFWFLARRSSGKVLLGMILGGLIGIMLPALVVGLKQNVNYHQDWVEKVVLNNAPGSGNWTSNGNISLRAQADRFFLNVNAFESKGKNYRVTIVELPVPIVRVIGQLIMLGVALVIGLYAVRFKDAPELISNWGGFALVFSLIPNFSPVSEIPHLVLLIPAYIYVVHLWYVEQFTDRMFRLLVIFSFVFTTLTTKTFCGEFLSRLLASLAVINLGILLLSIAIFRATFCINKKVGVVK
ncbi:MAG: DUF2029 domain-containing protein [Acidobacteriota bacterium]|nr:DUF2029 domain-containing protein [Acidobacteriota bacterium]